MEASPVHPDPIQFLTQGWKVPDEYGPAEAADGEETGIRAEGKAAGRLTEGMGEADDGPAGGPIQEPGHGWGEAGGDPAGVW